MQKISCQIENRDNEGVNLVIDAYADHFHVHGNAFFSLDELREKINLFRSYPIDGKFTPCIEGGYYDDDGSSLIQEHVHISVRPFNVVGGLVMTVKAFSPDVSRWEEGLGRGGRCDYHISYEGLAEFVEKFEELLSGQTSNIDFENFVQK